MPPKLIARTPEAYRYPLLIKHLLHAPMAHAGDQEIVYRDRVRLHLQRVRSPRAPSGRRPRRPRRRAGRHGRRPGLGQPPLSGVLLRRAHDGRGAAHRERAPLPRADPLHDRPRRGRRAARQRRVPARPGAALGPAAAGSARSSCSATWTGQPATSVPLDGEYEAHARALSPARYDFPDLDEDTLRHHLLHHRHHRPAEGRLLQPPAARAAHPLRPHGHGHGAVPGRLPRATTSTCRSRRCSTSTRGAIRTWPRCMGVKQVYPGRYEPDGAARPHRAREGHRSRTAWPPSCTCCCAARPWRRQTCAAGRSSSAARPLPRAVCTEALDRGIDIYRRLRPVRDRARPHRWRHLDPAMRTSTTTRSSRSAAAPGARSARRPARRRPRDARRAPRRQGHRRGRRAGAVGDDGYLKDAQNSEDPVGRRLPAHRRRRLHRPDGYLQVSDRIKDVIKTGGEWVSSLDLENLSCSIPA